MNTLSNHQQALVLVLLATASWLQAIHNRVKGVVEC
jgi:hypothetical protein